MQSSFTLEFHQHVSAEKRQWVLDRLADSGTSVAVTTINETTYEIACHPGKELSRLGWTLFQTHFPKFYRVIEVTGDAQLSANAYRKQPQQ